MGFQLGLFSANTESGLAITTAPERWSASWENNLRLARLADDVGIDFMLPVARWTDWGPDSDFHRSVLDPLVWATGLLAHTRRIRVFSTVHTARFIIRLSLPSNSPPPITSAAGGSA